MTSEEITQAIYYLEFHLKAGDNGSALNILIDNTDYEKCDPIDSIKWLSEDLKNRTDCLYAINHCAHNPYCSFKEAQIGFIHLKQRFQIFQMPTGYYLSSSYNPMIPIGVTVADAKAYWDENSYEMISG